MPATLVVCIADRRKRSPRLRMQAESSGRQEASQEPMRACSWNILKPSKARSLRSVVMTQDSSMSVWTYLRSIFVACLCCIGIDRIANGSCFSTVNLECAARCVIDQQIVPEKCNLAPPALSHASYITRLCTVYIWPSVDC